MTEEQQLHMRLSVTQHIAVCKKFGPEGFHLDLNPQDVLALLDRVQELDAQRKQLQSDAEMWKAETAQAEKWRGLAKVAQMRSAPLTAKQINELEAEAGLDQYELVRLVERAHGITGEAA